jgi:pimeloyl-ACP methyl ester carboxylesterase/DNA-binding CsgD family transcriptional regulator
LPRHIRFCTSADGVRIAYTSDGSGPPLVRAAFYLNHLQLDWECEVWKPWLQELSRNHTLVRHDMRGFGLSDEAPGEVSLDAWVRDLEAVVDALGLERFPLFGMCHGGAIAIEYAARHPDRVSALVLFGAYTRGALQAATSSTQVEQRQFLLKSVELGWGTDNEAFQHVWPTLLQPCSTVERLRSLAVLQRQSASGAMAVRLLEETGKIDVSDACARVQCPTLIFHPKGDRAAPFDEGRRLAQRIADSRLIPLDSDNHALTDDEPAWKDFVEEFRRFLPGASGAGSQAFAELLTGREREILERIAQGLDNAQIAAHLAMSEKTVKNHITRIFDKLAVENRSQAIVRAREAGIGLRGAAA